MKSILSKEIEKQDDVEQALEMNETVIDSLEVKIRSEVMNAIVLYAPRASDNPAYVCLY